MEWQVAEKWQYLESDGDTHVYWQYVDSNNAFTDKFINGGTISVTEDGTRKIHKDLIDAAEKIQINVTAYAVQAGGFADAAEAWISLSA